MAWTGPDKSSQALLQSGASFPPERNTADDVQSTAYIFGGWSDARRHSDSKRLGAGPGPVMADLWQLQVCEHGAHCRAPKPATLKRGPHMLRLSRHVALSHVALL